MKKTFYLIVVCAISIGVLLHSCKKEEEVEEDNSTQTMITGGNGLDTIDCNTITYDAHIATIFNRNCGGCHVTGSQGGVNFNNYDKLKNQLVVGNVIGVINHQPGFKKMPTSGIKISQRVLDSIDCWVGNGYKEN